MRLWLGAVLAVGCAVGCDGYLKDEFFGEPYLPATEAGAAQGTGGSAGAADAGTDTSDAGTDTSSDGPSDGDAAEAAACVPTPGDLIARWRGEDNAEDDLGLHSGTLVGNVGFVGAEVGVGFYFPGTDGKITASDTGFPTAKAGRTVLVWLSTTQTTEGSLFSYGAAGPSQQFNLRILGGYLNLWTFNSQATTSVGVADGQFHHVAVTVGSGGQVDFYLDGTNVAQGAPSIDTMLGGTLTMGEGFTGVLDEVEIYDRALEPTEIHAHYAAGEFGHCP